LDVREHNVELRLADVANRHDIDELLGERFTRSERGGDDPRFADPPLWRK
jgi:hypothetical protein